MGADDEQGFCLRDGDQFPTNMHGEPGDCNGVSRKRAASCKSLFARPVLHGAAQAGSGVAFGSMIATRPSLFFTYNQDLDTAAVTTPAMPSATLAAYR
ncbi:hypothetical protein [Noviherbaspirillum humi]|uniref:hypothetical protein n=1 Tax=Noviherbaspirillum humi TaxID=1688639 RepID=UPI0011609B30|nr:hypothetical protein [Noviherbaspirillum humi]